MKLQLLGIGSAMLALTAIAVSQVPDGDFEFPAMPSQQYYLNGIPGWTGAHGGSHGVWNTPFPWTAPHGSQIGYSNASSVSVQTKEILQPGAVYLSCYAGRRFDDISGDFRLELWVGGETSLGNVSGTLLTSSTFHVTDIAHSSYQLISARYSASPFNPHLGQRLSVRIVPLSSFQADFDDIRITSGTGFRHP